MAKVDHISVFATAPAKSSAPDSIALAGNDVWVAYTNGADSTGLSGSRAGAHPDPHAGLHVV
jgi:hypothetical protein